MTGKLWFRVHSFTGIVTGLMLFLICWTGTFAVISYELDWLVTPEMRQPATKQMNWPAIWKTAHKAENGQVFFTVAPQYEGMPATATIKQTDKAVKQLLIDPETGEVLDTVRAYNLQRFFRDIHRRIFYPMPWGLYLVGFFAITLTVSLIAALVFYKHWWRRFLQFRFHNLRSLLSAAHKTLGLWSIWFIVVISLTSIWYVFESVRYEFVDGIISYAGDAENAVIPIGSSDADKAGDVDIAQTFQRIQQQYPDLNITLAQQNTDKLIYVEGQTGWPLVRDRANQLYLDLNTGEPVYKQHASDLPIYWLWSDMADPLHFGNFAGLYSKAVWFVFGLMLSGIILSGTYLHAKRIFQRQHDKQRYGWAMTQTATILTIAIWLASIPVAIIQARNFFGDTLDGELQIAQLENGVSAFIYCWVLLTISIVYFWHRLLSKRLNK
ncbi:MAG: PepSY-associated TM helix domain-containing protein [Methylophaga sp.]